VRPPRKGEGAPEGPATDSKPTAAPNSLNPGRAIRKGVYVRPVAICLGGLGPDAWWLRSQPWAEAWLRFRAEAWSKAPGVAA
jgi:hypothetical protein